MKPLSPSLVTLSLAVLAILLPACACRDSVASRQDFENYLPATQQPIHPERPRTNVYFPSYRGKLPKRAKSTPEDGSFKIVTYNFNHIWAGNGYASRTRPKCAEGTYRAKLTVKGEGGVIIAEIFFIDDDCFRPGEGEIHSNLKSATIPDRGYFFLFFPASALAGVQQVLAQPGTAKNLSYYDHEWAIESVGDVSATH